MAALPISTFEFGPVDLLSAIVKFLGHIRGSKSHLLPKLLEYSEAILGCISTTPKIDTQWAPLEDTFAPATETMKTSAESHAESCAENAPKGAVADLTDWDYPSFVTLHERPN